MLNFIISFVVIGSFVYFEGFNKCYIITMGIKNTSLARYRKFRKINKLVSTNYKGFFTIFWVSLCMVLKVLWMSILQYLNNTVLQIEGNKYILTYVIKGKTYKMIVKPLRGPSKFLYVYDEKREEVSHLVFPYLSSEEILHESVLTPNFFYRKELLFELSNGTEKIFTEYDNIKI